MNEFQVNAEPRNETGKAAMRRMRRAGLIPGVLYGGEGADNQFIAMADNEVAKHLEHEAFYSHVLTIDIKGKQTQAVLKDVQRDPKSWGVLHIDFLRVDSTHAIKMTVPLHFVNEESAPGKKAGGSFLHEVTEIEISCLPQDLPEYVEVDLGKLELGESVHLSEIVLPSGVQYTHAIEDADHDHLVASLHAPKGGLGSDDEGGEAPAEPQAEAE